VTALLGTGAANLSPPKVCIKVLTIGPDSSSDPIPKMKKARIRGLFKSGAGDGNRTHASSLGSCSSTIELHPRSAGMIQKLT
jgi:hypothetical protein